MIIKLRKNYDDDMSNEDKNGPNQVEVKLKASETKINELKARIKDLFDLAVDKQYLIINDCAVNSDDDLLDAYGSFARRRHQNGGALMASANYDDDRSYEVFVFPTDEIFADKRVLDGLNEMQPVKRQVTLI